MEPPALPRFEATQRRDFLKRAAALGALALVPGLAACGKDDKDTFSDSSATSTSAASGSGTDGTAGDTTTTTAASGGASAGNALPSGAKLEVAFTYTSDGAAFGPPHNPFIASWVETADGALVATLSLWYNPPKGDRWVNNLASWYAAESANADVNGTDDLAAKTGATRPAGAYTVVWDGLDSTGKQAKQGDYVVFVESAVEHGTHSVTSGTITLGTVAATGTLADNGELSAGTTTYSV